MEIRTTRKQLLLVLLAASLGYFVDLYDLLIFSVVRSKSLLEIGVPQADSLRTGLYLLNCMLVGMMIGGVVWGVLGDKKGRLSVLFGSIILYSLANFLNGFVHTVDQYAVLRFVSGFGLAGELGAGVTLISEIMKPEKRGYGTMIMAAVGMLGASFAAYVGLEYDWRFAYKLGGVLGFALLLLRFGARESAIFQEASHSHLSRGNFFKLLTNKRLALTYIKSILLGLPVFFVIGILITGAPEFGKAFGMKEAPTAGKAVMVTYLFIAVGDLICSMLSQWMRSRKKPLMIFLMLMLAAILFYLYIPPVTTFDFYLRCALLGVGNGYLVLLVTTIAEQFGTNYRATATTTAPNFIRGLLAILIAPIFTLLIPQFGLIHSAAILGVGCTLVPVIVLFFVRETFGRSLDFMEEGAR